MITSTLAVAIAEVVSAEVDGPESQIHDHERIAEAVLPIVECYRERWEKAVGMTIEQAEEIQRVKKEAEAKGGV